MFESGRGKGECVVHQYISTSSGVVFSVSEVVSGKLDTDSESRRHDRSSASFSPTSDGCTPGFGRLWNEELALSRWHVLFLSGNNVAAFQARSECTFLGERAKDTGKEKTSLWSVLLDKGHVAMYLLYNDAAVS